MVTADPASTARSEPQYAFDFCGGHLAVDFTNTVGSRGAEREEHFATFGDVVAWAEARGIASRRAAAALRTDAADDPSSAATVLARAIDLREALYDVLAARARGRQPKRDALATLNRFVGSVYAEAALVPSARGFDLETAPAGGLDGILAPVVRAAVELLTAAEPRLGLCADDSCLWLFVDQTRSGTRRWCDMKVCGNRNKVRRFRGSA